LLALGLLLGLLTAAHAAPVVVYTNDPVAPNQTVMALGDGFGANPKVDIARLADAPAGEPQPAAWPGAGVAAEVLAGDDRAVKFVVPPTFKPGVYAWRVNGVFVGLLNRPTPWWLQGDRGPAASPGGRLMVCGRGLGGERGVLLMEGPQTRHVALDPGGPYQRVVNLPKDLAPGTYQCRLHTGRGGPQGWSEALPLAIEAAAPWPTRVYNVHDFGADGRGGRDDAPAIQAALDQAGADGGGTVRLPLGRYRVDGTLNVPRFVRLSGDSAEQVCLCWPEMAKPPEALIRGTNSFQIDHLTLYTSSQRHVIAADTGEVAGAGDVSLIGVRVRADIYRGHLEPKDVDSRLQESQRLSSGGGDTVRAGGRNVLIADCDLYGSGRCLYLSKVRGGWVHHNTFYNGRWGWYCISGSDGLILENNQIIGADLMSTGGGLNCLDGSTYSQHVLYAGNELSLMHGWDREAMTTDAGGMAYFGKLAGADGPVTTLAEDSKANGRDWAGAGFFILDGKGRGQWRRVVKLDGRHVTLDRPWDVPPDDTSQVSLTMFQGQYLFIGNHFSDAGVAVQLYGMACEAICDGNTSTRTAGFHNFGMNYDGIQPSWYVQWLNNVIDEGNCYRSGHDNYLLAGEAHLGIFALPPSPSFDTCLTLGCTARGNRLLNNAHLAIGGTDPLNPAFTKPCVQEVVVEANTIEKSSLGIDVRRALSGLVLRDNHCTEVDRPLRDEVAEEKAAEARRAKLLADPGPLASWSVDDLRNGVVADGTGHHFDAAVVGAVTAADGHGDKALKFAQSGYLRVDDPTMFNLQAVTVGLWLRADSVAGRQGLVSKRFIGQAAPFIVSLWDGGVEFEGTAEDGKWSFNFRTPALIKAGEWTHVAAVVEAGRGVTIYINGQAAGHVDNAAVRLGNSDPLILGREAWNGVNMGKDPCFYSGLLDDVKVWGRSLSAAEVAAEAKGK
jgi:hypothetical protein